MPSKAYQKRQKSKQYYQENRETKNASSQQYYREHREEVGNRVRTRRADKLVKNRNQHVISRTRERNVRQMTATRKETDKQ